MANEPAYQSGLSRLGREPSSRSRVSHQARWSVSSRAALQQQLARASSRRDEGLAVIQRLGGDLAGMIHAHQGGGLAPLGFACSVGSGLASARRRASGRRAGAGQPERGRRKARSQRAVGSGDAGMRNVHDAIERHYRHGLRA